MPDSAGVEVSARRPSHPAPPRPIVRSQSFTVTGGRRLEGAVPIGGYKHALTVVVAAAVATARVVTLRNVPITTESIVLERIVSEMGAASRLGGGVWELDTRPMRSMPVPANLSALVHGSLYLAPALLARFGEVRLSCVGGDQIGPMELAGRRPDAQVGAVMERFGASVDRASGIHARASSLGGATIDLLEFSSHPTRLRGPAVSSATKTALLLAAVAGGETVLRHPLDRDATRELCDFLTACGVAVTREEDAWRIRGGGHGDAVAHDLISDSTEIFTFIAGAAHIGGTLKLTGITGRRTQAAIADEVRLLRSAGVPLTWGPDWLAVGPAESIRPLDLEIECGGFSTDAHPLLTLVLLHASGQSRITEHVWASRFAYVPLLHEMDARLHVSGNSVRILPSRLRPPAGVVRPADSRAAAVAVLAALGAHGRTRIDDRGHLARSYEGLFDKLCAVGAQVELSDLSAGT